MSKKSGNIFLLNQIHGDKFVYINKNLNLIKN